MKERVKTVWIISNNIHKIIDLNLTQCFEKNCIFSTSHKNIYLEWILFVAIDLVVYFQDKTGLHLTVEDGQHMEAGELFEDVMEEMKLPSEAREVFSLWLVSDLLGMSFQAFTSQSKDYNLVDTTALL